MRLGKDAPRLYVRVVSTPCGFRHINLSKCRNLIMTPYQYGPTMKTSKSLLTISACAALTCVAGSAFISGLRINHTSSLPNGLWQLSPAKTTIMRGQIVSFCPPDEPIFRAALSQRILGSGRCPCGSEPMLKPVVAVAGDRVEITDAGVIVNGVVVAHTARVNVPTDNAVSNHVIAIASYNVKAGELWVVSAFHPRSFDSRYFGPILIKQVDGVATPILTWPSASNVVSLSK